MEIVFVILILFAMPILLGKIYSQAEKFKEKLKWANSQVATCQTEKVKLLLAMPHFTRQATGELANSLNQVGQKPKENCNGDAKMETIPISKVNAAAKHDKSVGSTAEGSN